MDCEGGDEDFTDRRVVGRGLGADAHLRLVKLSLI
jgi:hypothetical protein